MSAVVADASMTVACCVGEQEVGKDQADAFLDLMLDGYAAVPALWATEVAAVLLRKERGGKLSREVSERILAFLAALPVVMDEAFSGRIFTEVVQLARRFDLTVYDASYLELAKRYRLPLASLDSDLCRAATEAGVPVWNRPI